MEKQTDPNNPMSLNLKKDNLSMSEFANTVRGQYSDFKDWTDEEVAQGVVNKFPSYRGKINDVSVAPQAQADKWDSFEHDIGGITDMLFGPVMRAGATASIGAADLIGSAAKDVGGLLNAVGWKNGGKSLSDWGNAVDVETSMAQQTGVRSLGGGTTLPFGAKQATDVAKETDKGGSATGALAKATASTGLDMGGAALQLGSYVAGGFTPMAFMLGGGAAMQSVADGDLTKAGTYGEALVNGVLQGTAARVLGPVAGWVLGKTAVPALNWIGNKLALPVAEQMAKVGADLSGKLENAPFQKSIQFVTNLMNKSPQLFDESTSGNVNEILGISASKFKAVEQQYEKSLSQGFGDLVKLSRDEVEPSAIAFKRAQDLMKNNIGKTVLENRTKYASVMGVEVDSQAIAKSEEVVKVLKTGEELALKNALSSGTLGNKSGVLDNYISHVQATFKKKVVSVGDVMQLMDEGGGLAGNTHGETEALHDISQSLFRSVRSAISKEKPEVIDAWDEYYKQWQFNTKNISGGLAKAWANSSTLNDITDNILNGKNISRDQITGLTTLLDGDAQGTSRSLLFNAFMDKAGSLAKGGKAIDGAKYLEDVITKYGDLLDADQIATMEHTAAFGKENLQSQVDWIRSLKGLSPSSKVSEQQLEGLVKTQSQIRDIDSTGVLKAVEGGKYNEALNSFIKSADEPNQFKAMRDLLTPEQRVQMAKAMDDLNPSGKVKGLFQFMKGAGWLLAGSPNIASVHMLQGIMDNVSSGANKIAAKEAITYMMEGLPKEQFGTEPWLKVAASRLTSYLAAHPFEEGVKAGAKEVKKVVTGQ